MATSVIIAPTANRRDVLSRRIRSLVAVTITYNLIEAIVAITAGTIASSTVLVGRFGLRYRGLLRRSRRLAVLCP
jgi:hypothetical protein